MNLYVSYSKPSFISGVKIRWVIHFLLCLPSHSILAQRFEKPLCGQGTDISYNRVESNNNQHKEGITRS